MEVTVQWQMHRTKGARVLKHFTVAERSVFFASQVAVYQFFSECWRVACTKAFTLSTIVAGCWRGV